MPGKKPRALAPIQSVPHFSNLSAAEAELLRLFRMANDSAQRKILISAECCTEDPSDCRHATPKLTVVGGRHA